MLFDSRPGSFEPRHDSLEGFRLLGEVEFEDKILEVSSEVLSPTSWELQVVTGVRSNERR